MKIGVLIDRIIVGGVEKIAIEEVIAFRKAGHDATLLVLSNKYEPPTAFEQQLHDIPIVHLDGRLSRLFRFSFKFPLFNFFSFFHITYPFLLPFVVSKNEYDFILSHNPYTTFTALALSKTRRIPYIYYVNDHISYIFRHVYGATKERNIFSLLLPIATRVDKLLLNNAAAVLVSGKDHYADLTALIKNPSKLHFISPGHDAAKTIPKRRGDYFLIVTAWKEGKKIENLIDMLEPGDNFKLKFAGKWIHPTYRQKIEEQIKAKGLQRNISILGEVNEKDLNKLYRNARASIIYSNEKGFGMAALEAAANGCTFIIPDNCGAARYFRNKIDGLYYRYGEDRLLLKHLSKLDDEKLAHNMGVNAWRHAKQDFSWHNHISNIIKTAQHNGLRGVSRVLDA
jgi:glycosyltransferase involved in cell wall biosynthesis